MTWLATDEPAKKKLAFATMSRGWVLGSKAFKLELIEDQKHEVARRAFGEVDSKEVPELVWNSALQACLARLGKTSGDIASDRKAAPWKVAVARSPETAQYGHEPMAGSGVADGAPEGVSRYVAELKLGRRAPAATLKSQISNIMV